MSRLPFRISKSFQGRSPESSTITPAPNIPWHLIGAAQDHLLEKLEDMYWGGVRGELELIVRTLRMWEQPQHSSIVMDDEKDDFIHGFDTFIDQVSQESRAFAARYGVFRCLLCLSTGTSYCVQPLEQL